MASDGAPSVPRDMGSLRRAFLGYRRLDVDEALAERNARIGELERELAYISGIVFERDREIRDLQVELQEVNERHDASVHSLEAVALRLEELQVQARGQATRIRMKAERSAASARRYA